MEGLPARDHVQEKFIQWINQKEKAIPELKEALSSDQWNMRSHALLAMGKTGDTSLSPLIMDRLKHDDNQAVRNCAVIALGNLKTKEAVPYLLSQLDTNSVSQKVLIESLGKIGSPQAIAPLYRLFLESPESITRKVAEALITIGDKKVSRMIIRDREKIKSASKEAYALMILGELPVAGTDMYSINILRHGTTREKIVAAVTLGKIKSRRATVHLLPFLSHKHSLLQKQTSEALININDPASVKPLVNNLSGPESLAMSSAYILSRMTVEGITTMVHSALHQSTRVNGPAAYVLGRKQYTPALPLIRKRFSDPRQPGQRYLAEALGWLNDRDSIPLLIKGARRKNIQGAIGSIWSLGQLKAREAVPVLLAMMRENNDKLILYIISSLGSISDKRAEKPLIDFFYETGERYARYIGAALGKINGSEVITFIKDNMNSGEKYRIMAAGNALIKLRDPSLIPYAVELLNHDERNARKYAIVFLKKVTGKDFNREGEWKEWFARGR